MVRLHSLLSQLSPRSVLVVGDLMLDRYTIGKAQRISPEAPVAVVHVQEEQQRPGGAGNVILNLVSLGAKVHVLGRIGCDEAGEHLLAELAAEGVNTFSIFKDASYSTPVKNRIIASHQQVVRIDYERPLSITQNLEQSMIAAVPSLLDQVDVVAISDYGKGGVTLNLLKALMKEARSRHLPVVVDPKGNDFSRYSGATILKPNLSEAYTAAGCDRSVPLDYVAATILDQAAVQSLMITRSEDGISLYNQNQEPQHYPVTARQVVDVTGAGDTVLAMLAFALANQLSHGQAAQLANSAAEIAVSHFGCARVSLAMLARQLLEKDVTNKVFEEGHLYALGQALGGKKVSVLEISLKEGMNADHFEAIQEISSKKNTEWVLCITDVDPPPQLVNILASIQHVHYIVIGEPCLKSLTAQVEVEDVIR